MIPKTAGMNINTSQSSRKKSQVSEQTQALVLGFAPDAVHDEPADEETRQQAIASAAYYQDRRPRIRSRQRRGKLA